MWAWPAFIDTVRDSGILTGFEGEYPGIQLEWVSLGQAEIARRLAGPDLMEPVDVALVENIDLPGLAQSGGLANLSDRINPYLGDYDANLWLPGHFDGEQYSAPVESRPFILYYRRDIFEKAGLPDDPAQVEPLVATWDRFLEICKTIKTKTGSPCFASQKANNSGRVYEMMLAQQGLGFIDKQGYVTVDRPENIATLETLAAFWTAGVVSDSLEWTDAWYTELASRDQSVAAVFDSPRLGTALKRWIAPEQPGTWGAVRIPAMKAGQARSAGDGGSSLVVSAHSHSINQAWAFIEYLAARFESQSRLAQSGEFFPAYLPAYSAPQFDNPDPYFGGQAVLRFYMDTAIQVPSALTYSSHPDEIRSVVARAVQQVATRQAAPIIALNAAAEEIRDKFDVK